jgi:hypothetical protein
MVKRTKYLFVRSSMTYLTCGPKHKGVMITIYDHNDSDMHYKTHNLLALLRLLLSLS